MYSKRAGGRRVRDPDEEGKKLSTVTTLMERAARGPEGEKVRGAGGGWDGLYERL